MIKTVIFDLYGTLLELTQDSRPFLHLAKQCSTMSLQAAIQAALVNDCPTLATYASLLQMKCELNLEQMGQELADDLRTVRLFPDVLPVLSRLQEQKIKTAVISNLATPYKQPFDAHNLRPYFDAVLFSCDCGLSKPDPAIYRLAIQDLKTKPEETMMVGDSYASDNIGPAKVGIRGIHLTRSNESSSAREVISSLQSVPDLL